MWSSMNSYCGQVNRDHDLPLLSFWYEGAAASTWATAARRCRGSEPRAARPALQSSEE